MSRRYATRPSRRDATEADIVTALERAGWEVWRELPCDLLLYKPSKGFRTLETKSRRKANGEVALRNDQPKQAGFCSRTNTAYVTTAEEALRALGETT